MPGREFATGNFSAFCPKISQSQSSADPCKGRDDAGDTPLQLPGFSFDLQTPRQLFSPQSTNNTRQ